MGTSGRVEGMQSTNNAANRPPKTDKTNVEKTGRRIEMMIESLLAFVERTGIALAGNKDI